LKIRIKLTFWVAENLYFKKIYICGFINTRGKFRAYKKHISKLLYSWLYSDKNNFTRDPDFFIKSDMMFTSDCFKNIWSDKSWHSVK